MTITVACEKKNGLNWSILKAGVIAAIPQLPSPTLFVLLWFGTGSTQSGHGKAVEIEHVLLSSVWALHRESNRWTKWHVSDHTFAFEVHLHSLLKRQMSSFTMGREGDRWKPCAITCRRYFGPFISVWSWRIWNVLRHTSAWCTLTSCNMCHISECKSQHIEVFLHTAGPRCIKLSGETIKGAFKSSNQYTFTSLSSCIWKQKNPKQNKKKNTKEV